MSPVLRAPLGRVMRWHRPLMLMVASMLLLVVVSVAGLAFDDRVLLGAPVWLKPFKFAVSMAVYGTTLAWMLSLPHRGRRWTSGLATVFAVAGFVDTAIVAIQAARGTFSHFNKSTASAERVMQVIFGNGVLCIMLANLALAIILAVQRVHADRAMSRAIHTGLGLAVLGMALGFLIPAQGTAQTALTTGGERVLLSSGHSVGVPDGGPGLPLTQWSTTGGDLRIPHFVGLHGLQFMLIAALLLAALAARHPLLRDDRLRARLIGVAATSYTGLIALLIWQALRAQPLVRPDALTLAAAALLAALTTLAAVAVLKAGRVSDGNPLRLNRPTSTAAEWADLPYGSQAGSPGGPDGDRGRGHPAAAWKAAGRSTDPWSWGAQPPGAVRSRTLRSSGEDRADISGRTRRSTRCRPGGRGPGHADASRWRRPRRRVLLHPAGDADDAGPLGPGLSLTAGGALAASRYVTPAMG
ncbi:hypothetical protein ACBJ59_52205 [Nonomuraea sp. MTCD27]|uniref:hypothetical protein n=1 Tax=Nonomuraea sp. MTCD27 TaxID=1676747 RepID=UPI0035C060B4